MSGLIPLDLGAVRPPPSSLLTSSAFKRLGRYSPSAETKTRPVASVPSPSPSSPRSKTGMPSRPLFSAPAPASSRVSAQAAVAAQWKTALADVKRAYLNARYEQCVQRCDALLDRVQHQDEIQPVYLVFLRFYAVMALEAQAGSPHHSSHHSPHHSPHGRISLLQQAQAQYHAAADLAQQADQCAAASSRNSSPMPSLRSSTASDLCWSPTSIRMFSPAPSLCSVEDGQLSVEALSPPPAKPKKRVSFREVPDVEPTIWPDSPTLGFDDWLAPSASRTISPEPILKHVPRLSDLPLPISAAPRLPRQGLDRRAAIDVAAAHRMSSLLADIQDQIMSRLAALNAEIASCQTRAAMSKPVDGSHPNITSRIQRLRASGWRRPRFDARRYEVLREEALAYLQA